MRCDAEKFARMYKDIYKDLYKFALYMMCDTHNAEDAVSESVLKAYENIRQLKKEEAFKNWMFTILANVCRKRLRELTKEPVQSAESGGDGLTESAEHAVRETDCGLAIDVRRAFQILSEEEKEIVALSVLEGYNSKEIGAMLDLNANTVRAKRSRALDKMERILK